MSITTNCRVLEVGKVRRDAGALFGECPFEDWFNKYIAASAEDKKIPEHLLISRTKHIPLPVNVLVIQTESERILVDTGTPAVPVDQCTEDWTQSRLRNELHTINMTLNDITKVILTSFDIDHAGGLTRYSRTGALSYAFPDAEVFYHANIQERQRPRTIPNAKQAVEMLMDNHQHPCWEVTEVAPGITLHPTFGPSLQGCIVEISRGGDRLLYLGDLCPTAFHVNLSAIPAFDDSPEATYKERLHWIEFARKNGYKIMFAHGAQVKAAWIETTKGGLAVKPA